MSRVHVQGLADTASMVGDTPILFGLTGNEIEVGGTTQRGLCAWLAGIDCAALVFVAVVCV